MHQRIQETIAGLEALSTQATADFAHLSLTQLNWRPSNKRWSVAQCIDHLIVSHSLYFPILEKLASGAYVPSLWARVSPLSRLFGTYLVRTLSPQYQKKTKTAPKALPATSDLDANISGRYCQHQAQLIGLLQQMPGDIDPNATIITSPFLRLVTYSLDDCLTILVVHGQRHLLQAKRVIAMDAFPE